MAIFSCQLVGQIGRHVSKLGFGCLTFVGLLDCGGQVVEDGSAELGGGGQPSTLTPGGGGTSTTGAPTTAAPVCFGTVPQHAACIVIFKIPIIPASNAACVVPMEIMPNYRLNPAKLKFFFQSVDGTGSEIPYVGTVDQCASATTYGGWYATNIAGGSSDIGFCGCTCNAAHKYATVAEADCDGFPTG